jgi:hypothetical protein
MVRIEYQLTFEEFREAMMLARKRLIEQARQRGKPRSWLMLVFWIVVIAIVACVGLLMILPRPAATPSTDSLQRLMPHIYWFVLVVVLIGLLLYVARHQFVAQVGRMWESMIQLHQRRTVQFDDGGVHVADALTQAHVRWALYRRLEETPRLFLLFTSDFTFEIYPKRAFTDASAEELRQLVRSNIGERTHGFPVLPASQQSN